MNAPETVSQQIARMLSPDPCIILGCIHDYGHEGPHEIEPHVHVGPNYTGQFTDCCGNSRRA